MNNEPVAWIGETLMGRQYINGQKGILPVGTPLYTHPAKTLTDEEINELAENILPNEAIGFVPSWQWIEFARAILRKAQEK